MRVFCLTIPSCLLSIVFLLFSPTSANAQSYNFFYRYSFEPVLATKGPEIGGVDVTFPEAARKNGVSGTVKATFTLGSDGKTRDVVLVDDLPFGVGEAVKNALQRLKFSPAMNNSTPVDVKGTFTYEIAVIYNEFDKDVTKVKLLSKPIAEYPVKMRSEGHKGKVDVSVEFYPDGKVKVISASSTMPKEFDQAALRAAADLKFQPAVHKKTKQPVAQTIWVTFEFKP